MIMIDHSIEGNQCSLPYHYKHYDFLFDFSRL